jgi:nucleotide-binding universal stress UspA family protein
MSAPRHVLVATSLAGESEAVVRAGVAVARAYGGMVHLRHVPPPEALAGPWVGYEWIPVEAVVRFREAQSRALDEQAGRLVEDALRGTVEIVEGAPHRALAEAAERLPADLIVVGASERPGPLARVLGSTAERVLAHAPVPVLVVRGELRLPLADVLLPVDLSPLSFDAFRRAVDLLRPLAGPGTRFRALFVLSVVQRQFGMQFTPEQMDRLAADELRRFLERAGVEAPVEARVRVGEPRQGIREELAERPAELVALGTHGWSGFQRFALGSVASTIARSAESSVLVVPPKVRA